MREALDHAVITVRDQIDRAASIYRRMGFTLTERGFHAAGSCNHLMVFERDYLELIGLPPAGQKVRPDLLDAPIGLDGLVLATNDARAVYARLEAAGLPAGEPQQLTRMVRAPGGKKGEEEARFTTVRFPRGALAGGRLYFCQHETPHLVWNAAWQRHANGAHSIRDFTIAVPDPQAEAARYAVILGDPPRRIDTDTVALDLGHATLLLVTPATLRARLDALACDPTDAASGQPRDAYMAMVSIGVVDLPATQAHLERNGFTVTRLDAKRIAIPAREAMNCTISFVSP